MNCSDCIIISKLTLKISEYFNIISLDRQQILALRILRYANRFSLKVSSLAP